MRLSSCGRLLTVTTLLGMIPRAQSLRERAERSPLYSIVRPFTHALIVG